MKRLLLLVLLVAALWVTEPAWYGPAVRTIPAAGLFLPQPSGYRP